MTTVTMFSGKGGVGKTTCAAATALYHGTSGQNTLAISTDATPSLRHIFETDAARVMPYLEIREIGEPEVRQMWDEKFGREVYEVFSAFVDIGYDDFVDFMTSVLPGLGEEFMVDYIRDASLSGRYGGIVWDTAPLGQTLSLLQTPALLAEHLRMAPRIYSRLKVGRSSREPVLAILRRWETLSDENMSFLRSNVSFTLVTIPEALAAAQLEGIFGQLERFGLGVGRIIVNNVVSEPDSAFLEARAAQQRPYLEDIRRRYGHLKITELPMFPGELKGTARLQQVAEILFQT